MISKRAHQILDLIFAGCFFASPYIFGMCDLSPAKTVFFGFGAVILGNGLFNFHFIKLHMKIDLFIALMLFFAPSIFSYKALLTSEQFEVHVILGFLLILMVGETLYRPQVSIAGTKVLLEN